MSKTNQRETAESLIIRQMEKISELETVKADLLDALERVIEALENHENFSQSELHYEAILAREAWRNAKNKRK